MDIRKWLKDWGFGPHLKGYHYIIKACEILKDKKLASVRMQDLEQQVGNYFGVSASHVERNIRHAIQDYANIDENIKVFIFELAEKVQLGEVTIGKN